VERFTGGCGMERGGTGLNWRNQAASRADVSVEASSGVSTAANGQERQWWLACRRMGKWWGWGRGRAACGWRDAKPGRAVAVTTAGDAVAATKLLASRHMANLDSWKSTLRDIASNK